MVLNRRTLSAQDAASLADAVNRAGNSWLTYTPHLDFFRSFVRRGRPTPATDVPDDVITMNSRFVLENVNTGESGCYALVYPEQEATRHGRISVLSPAGMALLGARVDEEVCWTSAAGPEVAKVQRLLHQPEAAMRRIAPAVRRSHAALVGRN